MAMTTYSVIITDCDHPSVDIEQKIMNSISADMKLCQCKTEDDVIRECGDAEALINQYAPLTRRVLSQLPACKVIVRYGVGVNNVDLEAASEYGIQICNVPDYGVDEVSDHALALMFTLTRKTMLMANDVRKGNWDFSISRPILRLRGQVMGVVGLGRIGGAFAAKAHGIGFRVVAVDDSTSSFERYPYVEKVSFDKLLALSDVISIHCPLDSTTHHLFGEREFQIMKPSAYLINTARGPIVSELALERALNEGWIAGAGLDVMEIEPPDMNSPLIRNERFIATPHVAWYSEQAFDELKSKAALEAARVLKGEKPHYPVNQPAVKEGA
jgi:D-3-phosphoglycerate dehydrogenase